MFNINNKSKTNVMYISKDDIMQRVTTVQSIIDKGFKFDEKDLQRLFMSNEPITESKLNELEKKENLTNNNANT